MRQPIERRSFLKWIVTRIIVLATVSTFCLIQNTAKGQNAEEVLRAARLTAGLVVHLGVSDGQLELDLAKGGRLLVHGLSEDEASLNRVRRKLTEAGVYGVASVEMQYPQPKLPYAADLVNVLIADKALLARRGIEPADVLRVLVPGGMAYLKDGDAWKAATKPWPEDFDDWTHFDHDCTGNPVSRDTQVGPVTTLKWIDGYRGGGGARSWIWRGTMVHERANPGRQQPMHLAVRDSFNGLPHYFLPCKTSIPSTVVADGKIFTMANPEDPLGPMRAYDLATGKELLQFDEGGKLETPAQAGGGGHAYQAGAPRWVRIVYHQGRLLQTANDSLYALDAQTGKRQWVYRDADGHRLLFAAVAPDLDRVFVAVTRKAESPMSNDWGAWNSRWPGSPLVAIVALELQTGKQVWRNAEMAGPAIGQLVYDEGRLAFFTPSGIGAPAFPDRIIGALDAKSGKLKWSRDYLKDPLPFAKQLTFPGFQFNIALRNGKLYLTNQNGVVEFDADTGEPLKFLALPVNNGRCTRPRLTTQYHLIGFGSFVAGDLLTSVNQNISRGACATGMTPANGMIYLPPTNTSFQCWCFAMLRGWAGYAAEPLSESLPIAQRTQAGSGAAAPRIIEQVRRAEPVATIKVSDGMMGAKSAFEVPVPRFDGEMVRNAWSGNDVLPYPETEPIKAGDLELVAVVNEHRLEARRGERVVWSFVADGRISAAPVVHEGKVCLGSHDGWVSCLDLRDGRVLWRFLAAPNHRKIVAYGQLESSWPVYGVVVHDGLFAVSAGRHPELDGGIYFYGLDPATGQARWDRRLRTVNEPVAGRGARKLPNTIINGPLSVSDGKLVLVSRDMTNEGAPRMGERYQVVIDPHSEGQPTMPTRPNVKKTAPAKAKPKAAN